MSSLVRVAAGVAIVLVGARMVLIGISTIGG